MCVILVLVVLCIFVGPQILGFPQADALEWAKALREELESLGRVNGCSFLDGLQRLERFGSLFDCVFRSLQVVTKASVGVR